MNIKMIFDNQCCHNRTTKSMIKYNIGLQFVNLGQ